MMPLSSTLCGIGLWLMSEMEKMASIPSACIARTRTSPPSMPDIRCLPGSGCDGDPAGSALAEPQVTRGLRRRDWSPAGPWGRFRSGIEAPIERVA